ncbi:ATP-binding cassette domain-containing protein [Modestobacter sp. I12A-02628]|uniref:Sugar ABC transporter ATP-binding protein n=1 Tax=Goekera deserti TaxID=2497753 RepID=A0A7K3WFD3_9ACTN|nr:sugar ABC transporter ATP-binding protein [Goekera deserti]MPQ99560.1 ATP-binding cassette domain-containing protein [Goekera deserti]NDI46428.1 ATP-binding cassette domain-containing protein [Goekera deserti]NEL54639.1 sugar ABC transporter ATP-binding protein [Goekera deserti]
MPAPDGVALQVRGLSKTFPGTRALADVSLTVRRGTAHALLGGNGSGKSTLIKVLAGVYTPDRGAELQLSGRVHDLDQWSPIAARDAGLRFVHQDIGIVERMTVAENLALARGFPTAAGGRVDWRALRRYTQDLLDRFEISVAPDAPMAALRPSDRTMVAIARALQDDEDGGGADGAPASVLVLDEPTASLPEHEVDVLLDALRRRVARGATILYVSHRIQEVLSLTDEITVLRDGRRVGTVTTADVDERAVVELIAGRPVESLFPEPVGPADDDPALTLSGVSAGLVHDVDLHVRRGEIVGVAGLLGSGRTELLRAVFGDLPLRSGSIAVAGRPVVLRSPLQAIEAGLAFVPEDRRAHASFPALTVRENLSAAVLRTYFHRLGSRRGQEVRDSQQLVDRFGIRTASVETPFDLLSGGNQQKTVLARWLRRRPAVVLLDEPTQGVDVVARADIYRQLREAAAAGTAAVVVASDFDELAHLCDRVVVLRGGRLVAEVSGPQLSAGRLVELAYSPEQVIGS